jgi:hypothetical protein
VSDTGDCGTTVPRDQAVPKMQPSLPHCGRANTACTMSRPCRTGYDRTASKVHGGMHHARVEYYCSYLEGCIRRRLAATTAAGVALPRVLRLAAAHSMSPKGDAIKQHGNMQHAMFHVRHATGHAQLRCADRSPRRALHESVVRQSAECSVCDCVAAHSSASSH